MEIPDIDLPSSGIREIKVYGPNLWNIPRDLDSKSLDVDSIGTVLNQPPQAIPPVVPVVTTIGTLVVNIPGCVNVHKENARQRSKNKVLPQDDPEGTITLCDGGGPTIIHLITIHMVWYIHTPLLMHLRQSSQYGTPSST